jgi:hypothetical protein
MQEVTEEKDLIKRDTDNSFFNKIKLFFTNLFGKNKVVEKTKNANENIENQNEKSGFINSIKVESEVEANPELLELQQKVRNGEIKIEDLTDEEENQLIDLYDKQIAVKKARIEELRIKIEKLKKVS